MKTVAASADAVKVLLRALFRRTRAALRASVTAWTARTYDATGAGGFGGSRAADARAAVSLDRLSAHAVQIHAGSPGQWKMRSPIKISRRQRGHGPLLRAFLDSTRGGSLTRRPRPRRATMEANSQRVGNRRARKRPPRHAQPPWQPRP